MVGILTLDDVLLISSSIDPSITGYTAPIGSVLTNNVDGKRWQKVGSLDTDWALGPSVSLVTGELDISVIPESDVTIDTTQITNFNEDVQDAVGGSLTDTNSIDLTYNDGLNTLSADVRNDSTTGATVAPLSVTVNGVGAKVDNLTVVHTAGVLAVGNIAGVALGSVDKHTDVDTITVLPAIGDSLIWNGTNWIPTSAAGAAATNNYVFAYDTTTQSITLSPTFVDVVFSTNGQIDDWLHTAGTANFTAPVTGLYVATAEFIVSKSGTGSPQANIKCSVNGVDVPGAANGMDLTSNNTSFSISRTFLFSILAGQIFKISASASSSTVAIIPAPTPANVAEVRTVACIASTTPPAAGTISGDYWLLDSAGGGSFYIWYNTGASTDPLVAGRIGVPVVVTAAATATAVAIATETVFLANATILNNFTTTRGAGPSSHILTITDRISGAAVNAAAGTSGFTVTTTIPGVGSPSPSCSLTIRRMT